MAHDLYHHQVGEFGEAIEEFRALGASHYFNEIIFLDIEDHDYKLQWKEVIDKIFTPTEALKYGVIMPSSLIENIPLVKKIKVFEYIKELWLSHLMEIDKTYIYLKLYEGYNYAR